MSLIQLTLTHSFKTEQILDFANGNDRVELAAKKSTGQKVIKTHCSGQLN